MHDTVERLSEALLETDEAVDREFEARLVETSTLAFRVAYNLSSRILKMLVHAQG